MKQDRLVTFGRLGWRRGFTLIELLIVVAIIAILAAIAVPNFMEAQIRAKVARVHADMYTLALALEAYFADYTSYPLHYFTPYFVQITSGGDLMKPVFPSVSAGIALSTPVAYLTSALVRDVFASSRYHDTVSAIGADYAPNFINISTGDTGSFYRSIVGIEIFIGREANVAAMFPRDCWMLMSVGPDRTGDTGTLGFPHHAPGLIYDPTNGSQSTGDILRTNTGRWPKTFFGPPLTTSEGDPWM